MTCDYSITWLRAARFALWSNEAEKFYKISNIAAPDESSRKFHKITGQILKTRRQLAHTAAASAIAILSATLYMPTPINAAIAIFSTTKTIQSCVQLYRYTKLFMQTVDSKKSI